MATIVFRSIPERGTQGSAGPKPGPLPSASGPPGPRCNRQDSRFPVAKQSQSKPIQPISNPISDPEKSATSEQNWLRSAISLASHSPGTLPIADGLDDRSARLLLAAVPRHRRLESSTRRIVCRARLQRTETLRLAGGAITMEPGLTEMATVADADAPALSVTVNRAV